MELYDVKSAMADGRVKPRTQHSGIRTREEHHRGTPFEQEFKALLKAHRIEFDEKYLWTT